MSVRSGNQVSAIVFAGDAFQIHSFPNLMASRLSRYPGGSGHIDLTNIGVLGADPFGPGVNNAGYLGYGVSPANFAPGMRAWAVTAHTLPTSVSNLAVTESEFLQSPLSHGELTSITQRCAFIVGNGSGAGQCPGCTAGILSAIRR